MIEKNKINLDLSDRPILNQLLETNMFAKKELDKAGEEYFLLATPCEEDLRINVVINGKETEVYIPEFLGAEITKQTTVMKKATEGYKMWVCCHNQILQALGFFKSRDLEEMVFTKREEEKVQELEKVYPMFRKDFKKYELVHYYMNFSRLKTAANSREDLENIRKCLKPYYEYFEEGNAGHDLLKFYPKNVIRGWHKFPKIMEGGQSYVIRVCPPHLTIAIGVQALPYMDKIQQSYVREALQLALSTSRSYPETFANLSEVKKSEAYIEWKSKRAMLKKRGARGV